MMLLLEDLQTHLGEFYDYLSFGMDDVFEYLDPKFKKYTFTIMCNTNDDIKNLCENKDVDFIHINQFKCYICQSEEKIYIIFPLSYSSKK